MNHDEILNSIRKHQNQRNNFFHTHSPFPIFIPKIIVT